MPINIEINQRVGKKIDGKWASKVIKAVLRQVGVRDAEISIAIVGDQKMKRLNRKWRGKNRSTDVLSFTYQKKPLMGEIIICYPQAVRQAKERKHSARDEIKILLIHGLLHLCGHDHEKSIHRAKRMEALQNKILEKLKIENQN